MSNKDLTFWASPTKSLRVKYSNNKFFLQIREDGYATSIELTEDELLELFSLSLLSTKEETILSRIQPQ